MPGTILVAGNTKKHVSAIGELIFEREKHTQKFQQAAHSLLHTVGIQGEPQGGRA